MSPKESYSMLASKFKAIVNNAFLRLVFFVNIEMFDTVAIATRGTADWKTC